MKSMLCGYVCLLALASTLAAQGSLSITAEIPFPFFVGDKQMAAGEYLFAPSGNPSGNDFLRIVKVQTVTPAVDTAYILVAQFQAVPKVETKENLVVFNKYGEDRIFLTQITPGGMAIETVKGKKEREAVTSTLHASNYPTKVVVVALR